MRAVPLAIVCCLLAMTIHAGTRIFVHRVLVSKLELIGHFVWPLIAFAARTDRLEARTDRNSVGVTEQHQATARVLAPTSFR